MRKTFTIFIVLFAISSLSVSAQWERLNGPTEFDGLVGNITCITTNDSFVWIGTAQSGIFRYDNLNPNQWKAINKEVLSYSILSITYNHGTLVATTDRGIYLSVDFGDNWTAINEGLPLEQKITSFTAANGVLFAATEKYGIFRSTNNGQDWEKANNGLLDNNILQLKADANSIWALSRNAGLFKSTDNGQSWQSIGVPNNCINCSEMAIVDSSVFIAQDNLLVSRNGGKTWQQDNSVKNVKRITAYQGLLIANSDYRLYLSNDTGNVWQLELELNLDSTILINTALSVPNNIIYVATQSHGLARSTIAAVTWKPFNFGLLTANIEYMQWYKGSLYALAFGRLYRTNDNGDNWTDIGGFGNTASSFFIENDKVFVSTYTDGVFTADYQLLQWQQINNDLGSQYVNRAVRRNNTLYALTDKGIYFSPNNGTDWFHFADAIGSLLFTDMLFDKDVLYAGTTEGLYKSTPTSNGFIPVDSTNLPRRHVHFLRKINGQIWAKIGIDTHISDDGNVWPKHYYIGGVTFGKSLSVVQSRLYAATTSGYMFKDTAGQQWNYIKAITGLDANTFELGNTYLFAGTSAGVWRLPATDIATGTLTISDERKLIVYPNPATTTLNIVGENIEVKSFKVYTAQGQEILSQPYARQIDLKSLENGLYLFRFETDGEVITKKVIVKK